MAFSKVKFRLCLLALTLFLACVSVGLGAEGESLGSGVGVDNGCVNGCQELKGKNLDEYAACEKRCGVNQEVTEICRQWCQVMEPHGGEQQQRRCRQECEERLRDQKQGEDVEDKWRDPEREREEQRRREHEREERRRRERERERERGRGHRDENDRDPEREREERRREEQRREQEQRRREQERRERERRGEREDEEENQRGPDWRREQERREQERRRREQERERRERERRGEREDEEENQRDPDRRREQERREQERRRREQEQERRERERRGEREDEEENQRDPDRRREQERREQERRRREQEQERRERERRGEREDEEENQRDPDRRREQERREQERRRREQEQREREWEREHGRGGSQERRRGGQEEEISRKEEWEREERRRERQHGGRSRANEVNSRWTEQEQSHNPYYFQERQFQSRFRSDQGQWRVLERFSERSELLRGLKNQRLAILEARPQTFIIPHHIDAESVLFVVKGRATITTIVQERKETRKESYNVERGDVVTIPAGTTVYLANQENEDLQIVKLIQPVNNPGEFKDYLSGGGEAQSYYSVFSNDVLEAALNIPRDRLERIFKQRGERRGKIIRASQEQLKALSQRATSVKKGGRGARSLIKLESQSPVYNNQYGQMYEACPDEFPQLRRTDVATSVLDIKQGGMMVPHFNSRATWVVFVSEGTGSFEMGCPHVQGSQWQRGRREEERQWRREEEKELSDERSGRIERIAGRLSQGGVLVIPAGHPIAIMASPNENLRLVGFGINAENNKRNFLAGRENIMNEVDREAKELTFNVEGKQAEETFKSQKESFFTEGPEGGRRRSTETERTPLFSILKLAGYF
ncbi:vicilin Jug r 2.0101 [Cucumis melo]|uniref:Vicilin Jug r 2.0101 n=1 Tax=Cucumis melo TaxID=3656 RepID=A0ABM3KXN0_CUCME|nr:vicilin Jug r 2.0101 [Cucumis melo]